MTRFARAKGSKSSNERLPEEATSWTEIKEQMQRKKDEVEFNKKLQEANVQREANYKAFLEETEAEKSKDVKWADFPGAETSDKSINRNKKVVSSKKDVSDDDDDDEEFNSLKSKLDSILDKKEQNGDNEDSDDAPEEVSAKTELKEVVVKRAKTPKKKLLSIVSTVESKPDLTPQPNNKQTKGKKGPKQPKAEPNPEDINLTEAEKLKLEKKKLRRKKQVEKKTLVRAELKKRKLEEEGKSGDVGGKKPKVEKAPEDLTEEEKAKIERKKAKQLRQAEKRRTKRAENAKQKEEQGNEQQNNGVAENEQHKPNNSWSGEQSSYNGTPNNNRSFEKPNKFNNSNNNNNNKGKPGKIRDKEEHPRKKPQMPNKMMINGKEVEVDYVDGFPVKKEDAERLKQLRKQMISKGLPRSEINIAMKLERRKAEKAFAREKKKVCFHCRKSGHNLSECPDLDNNQAVQTSGSGICFKCGSTEHTHFECKVVRGQEFKFASCFICNEQGHIARQCPDNARGLYPKGGACNVCGDVTHLKKDCPKYQAQQQRDNEGMQLETFNGGNPDALSNSNTFSFGHRPKPNKIIKF